MLSDQAARRWLDLAALHALRAEGHVEPNPLVGCVIVPTGIDPEIPSLEAARALVREGRVALAHHRRFGGPHAEIEALRACERLGHDPRGSTVLVTLEPCNHWGQTGPCSEALVRAGVGCVLWAREDHSKDVPPGAVTLAQAHIPCARTDASPLAHALSEPFFHRLRTGLPWVIGKWAQSIDGRGATSFGESQWLTGPRARRHVHTLRARVDAIITGVGTVLADDPLLTARAVPLRRAALRVIIDPRLETPCASRLAQSASQSPVVCVCAEEASQPSAQRLEGLGVEILRVPQDAHGLDLTHTLALLAQRGVSTVMTEAGPRLMGRLVDAGLINELRAYVAPLLLADPSALPTFAGARLERLGDAPRWSLAHARRIDDDIELRYRSRGPD